MLTTHRIAQRPRRGIILLVVIAMLALFATVALSFVYYAESVTNASQLSRQTATTDQPEQDAEYLFSYFLSQLIYDTENPYSALRGHSLGRAIYGLNPGDPSSNYTPFNGVNRLRYKDAGLPGAFKGAEDNYYLINYQRHDADGFVRNPEFYGGVDLAGMPFDAATYRYVAGNAPWTAPDLNNMYLAHISASGEVLIPSFHRPWLDAEKGITHTPADTEVMRYMTLFPHKKYHAAFPDFNTEDAGVRNLDSSPGYRQADGSYLNIDSYWMDIGAPIMTAASGKKYKALFAALVLDQDSRINAWVSGNLRGNNAHVSNRGHGRGEINFSRLEDHVTAGSTSETQAFFNSRYPLGNAAAPGLKAGPAYAPLDYDGLNGTASPVTATGAYTLPTMGSYRIFPDFTNAGKDLGYNNLLNDGSAQDELKNHPHSYNIFNPNAPQSPASELEAILRFSGKNSPAVTSTTLANLRNTLASSTSPQASLRVRNQFTTMSWSFDRPSGTGYVQFDPINAGNYTLPAAGQNYPKINTAAVKSPDFSMAAPANSEFLADFRAKYAGRLRFNLNQPGFRDFPAPDAAKGLIDLAAGTNQADYDAALTDRTEFARRLYLELVKLTGAQDPNLLDAAAAMPTPPLDKASDDFRAARWLAQLAVNITDYLDPDDYATPFKWFTSRADATDVEHVYGTELPRLVLNETYVQYDNDALDNGIAAGKAIDRYKLNVWTELLNPHSDTSGKAYPRDDGKARLINGNNEAVYQIHIYESDVAVKDWLANSKNTSGDPGDTTTMAFKKSVMETWDAAKNFVLPVNGAASGTAGSNEGFYVLGPAQADPAQNLFVTDGAGKDANPMLTATHSHASMSVDYAPIVTYPNPPTAVTLVLRRLANPALPKQTDATKANYNPYITVDYVEDVKVHDNRFYNNVGLLAMLPDLTTFASNGRRQPYAAALLENSVTMVAKQPRNSFYNQNNPIDDPFDWLVHLDRPLINSVELLHVSCYSPHLLTQKFVSAGKKFQHNTAWMDQASLIYRLLEHTGTPDQMAGAYRGGRVPGKVNVNLISDPLTLQALADPQNTFTQKQVYDIYNAMVTARGYGMQYDASASTYGPFVLSTTDAGIKPFTSYSSGHIPAGTDQQFPGGRGMEDTLLRSNGAAKLFDVPGATHPYQRMELLQKISNNVTTTSNVFAVWLTVGFFEVVDETARPPKLGAEVGRAQNQQIRHRMFAIIDRSELKLFTTPATAKIEVKMPAPGNAANILKVSDFMAMTGTMASGKTWNVQAGMELELRDSTTGQISTVTVEQDSMSNLVADFNHLPAGTVFQAGTASTGTWVSCRGNPGPMARYSPRTDRAVVPHYTIID